MPTIDFTPDNTPPSPVALPDYTGTAVAPSAVELPDSAPTGAGPSAVAIAGMAPAGDAPDPIDLGVEDRTGDAPSAVPVGIAAPDNTAPGVVPDGFARLTSDTPRIIGYTPPLSTPTDDLVNTPILKIEGALALNATYGQTRIPAASALTRVQLSLQDAPVGGPATITLVDALGTSYGVSVTVADGEKFGETVLGAPLALPPGTNLVAKATAVPGGNAGGFGVVTLFTQLAS